MSFLKKLGKSIAKQLTPSKSGKDFARKISPVGQAAHKEVLKKAHGTTGSADNLTPEQVQQLTDLGIYYSKDFGALDQVSDTRSRVDSKGSFDNAVALINDSEFLAAHSGMTGSDLATAYKTWVGEQPMRTQARNAKATIDLGMENTPEIIAGGTASANRDTRRRRVPGTPSNSLATALGLGTPSSANSLGIY